MTLQTQHYVLGFAFWQNQVALIWKTKGPHYVIHTWNGIGGKIEAQDESVELAMMREFAEETHLVLGPDMWKHFATQSGPGYILHCLMVDIPDDFDASHIVNTEDGDEDVMWAHLSDIADMTLTPNLAWLIPLALDQTTGFLEITEL